MYSLCHHECQNSGDFSGLDHIRLPRLDTDQLVSSMRMRCQCASVKRFLCARPFTARTQCARSVGVPFSTDGGRRQL